VLLRDELLAWDALETLLEAKVLIERWRSHYNTGRPHSALRNRTPSEFSRPVAGHAQLPALHG
jgi:transposase InsO family protein